MKKHIVFLSLLFLWITFAGCPSEPATQKEVIKESDMSQLPQLEQTIIIQVVDHKMDTVMPDVSVSKTSSESEIMTDQSGLVHLNINSNDQVVFQKNGYSYTKLTFQNPNDLRFVKVYMQPQGIIPLQN